MFLVARTFSLDPFGPPLLSLLSSRSGFFSGMGGGCAVSLLITNGFGFHHLSLSPVESISSE
jgi:hypothetical protein